MYDKPTTPKTQEEKDRFSLEWRKRYLTALKNIYRDLKDRLAHDSIYAETTYDWRKEKELLELEHQIYFEEIIYNDFLIRVQRYNASIDGDFKDAKENFDGLVEKAKQTVEDCKKAASLLPNNDEMNGVTTVKAHDRLESLLKKIDLVNRNDAEQLVTLYKSIKLELTKLEPTVNKS